MTSSNILDQAIADANLLKSAALKNAQDAILEQFAPEVKKRLNRLLEAELGLDDEESLADPTGGLNPMRWFRWS